MKMHTRSTIWSGQHAGHISPAADVHALDRSRSHLRRGPPASRANDVATPRACLDRAKSNIDAARRLTDRSSGITCDRPIVRPDGGLHRVRITPNFAAHPLQGPRPARQDAGLHHQQLLASGRHHLRALQKPLAGGTLLQAGASSIFGSSSSTTSENAVKTQIWIAVSVYVLVAIVKKRLDLDRLALHFVTDPLGDPLRENAHTSRLAGDENPINASQITNQLNLFDF